MIHLVFEKENVEKLRRVFALDSFMQGDIINLEDNYAIGNISEGWQQRKNWWQIILQHAPTNTNMDDAMVNDKMSIHRLRKHLEEDINEQLWIWMAQNPCDVCGYYWLVEQLKKYQGRVHILFLNNLPFLNYKGNIFYPIHLYEIPSKEFLKAKKLERIISLSEFEIDGDEWIKLCEENKAIRILEGGKKIIGKDLNYFDNDILNFATKDFQKLQKLLQNIAVKSKSNHSEILLVWRIQKLVADGKLLVAGNWDKSWKDIEIRKV